MHIDDVNLGDADAFAGGPPHEYFALLRSQSPVTRHTRADGSGFWSVVRHDDIMAIEPDVTRFTSTTGASVQPLEEQVENLMSGRILIFMDPPRHTIFRRLVSRAFTPKACTRLEESMVTMSVQAIDRVIEAGSCDFVDVAAFVPLGVIAELLGVPEADREQLYRWTNDVFGREDPSHSSPERFFAAVGELSAYANDLAIRRRADPGDDIFSAVASAEEDGQQLSELELGLFFMQLVTAGNETTRTLILHGTNLILEHRPAWERLAEDQTLLPNAIEEMLRCAAPIHAFGRGVTTDVTLHDQLITAGDQVVLWYTSGNRDEAVFDDPDRFDIFRPNAGRHLSFGAAGPHHCLGAALARMESKIVFADILRRLPDLELDGDLVRLRSNFTNGIVRMPVRFTPGRPVGDSPNWAAALSEG